MTTQWALPLGLIGYLGAWLGTFEAQSWVADPDDEEFAIRRAPRCGGCDKPIRVLESMPVISWFGSTPCGKCSGPRSVPWIATEAAVALSVLISAVVFGPIATLIIFLVLAIAGPTLANIDARTMLLPRRLVWLMLASAILAAVAATLLMDIGWGPLSRAVIAATVNSAIFGVLYVVHPGGLGFGDVRLAAPLGFAVGWLSIVLLLPAALLASILAIATGVLSGTGRSNPFPFGPALIAGSLITIWLHDPLLRMLLG